MEEDWRYLEGGGIEEVSRVAVLRRFPEWRY